MTDRELMQKALEALEQSNTKAPFGADGVVYWEGVKTHEAAVTAIRERLAQPEQEPLTDEEITALVLEWWCPTMVTAKDRKFVRAIERAHGIGGKE